MERINSIINSLRNFGPWKLVLWGTLINLTKSFTLIAFGVYEEFLNIPSYPLSLLTLDDITKLLFNFVILTPLLETFLFQYLIIKLTTKYVTKNLIATILISSGVFASFHTHIQGDLYIVYIMDKWMGGLVLATLFITLDANGKSGLQYTAISHAIVNGVLLIYTILNLTTI